MKTNKIYIAAATLALALSACSEQADFTQADIANAAVENANAGDVPVAFSTYLGTAGTTRASNPATAGAINATSDLHTSGFGVFAYLTGSADYAGTTAPNFMYNQSVTYGTAWTYTPVKYWPNGIDAANAANSPSNTATEAGVQKLSFFAYAPYVASVEGTPDHGIMGLPTNNSATRPIITYKLPTTPTASSTVDLLWGIRGQLTYDEADGGNNSIAELNNNTYNTNLTKQTTTERVKFLFKHALAKIGAIKVVADVDGNSDAPTTSGFGSLDGTTLITLEEIQIKDNGGTVITQNKFDISQGTWSTAVGDIEKSSDGADVAAAIKAKSSRTTGINSSLWELASGSPAYSSGWTSPGTGVPADAPADIYTSGYSPIMFIPGSGQELKITVKYVVRTYDEGLDETSASGGEGKWSKVTQTITNQVILPTLQPNTNYTLIMHLGLTSVKFSAEVADWDDGSTEVIWLPSNVVTAVNQSIAWSNSGSATGSVSKDAGTYTINITGLTAGKTVAATSSSDGYSSATITYLNNGTSVGSDGKATVAISYNANSSSERDIVVTLTSDTETMTLTLTQAAGS